MAFIKAKLRTKIKNLNILSFIFRISNQSVIRKFMFILDTCLICWITMQLCGLTSSLDSQNLSLFPGFMDILTLLMILLRWQSKKIWFIFLFWQNLNPNWTFGHFSACTFVTHYLHQFSAVVLLGTNLNYIWCRFSINIKKIMPELQLLKVLFGTNVMRNISIKKHPI